MTNNIIKYRKAVGMTRVFLASQTNIKLLRLVKIEKGSCKITLAEAKAICHILQKPFDDIFPPATDNKITLD